VGVGAGSGAGRLGAPMFTGIILERGTVLSPPAPSGLGGRRLVLGHGAAVADRLEVGASLAVSGVCLTVTEIGKDGEGAARSVVELSPETLERTTLDGLAEGDEVNLEPALRVGDPLGGHWVQGHVDGTVELLGREDGGEHSTFTLELPAALAPYLVEKGSVALDGVSLTVARRLADRFTVALIPHTLAVTTLGGRRPGDRLNVEVDVLAKYVEGLLAGRPAAGAEAPA